MLKKVKELPAKDLETLLIFVNLTVGVELLDNINEIIDGNHVKYTDLLLTAINNRENNVLINVEDVFDKIMFEAYDVYYQLKDKLNDAHKKYKNIDELNMIWNFIPLYEKLLSSSKFSHADTRTVQKMYFENLLKDEIKHENYEKCSEIQNLLKTI